MLNEDQQLAALYHELADMEAIAGTLKHAIQQAESLLSEQKAAYKRLVGTHLHSGNITSKNREIEKLKGRIRERFPYLLCEY